MKSRMKFFVMFLIAVMAFSVTMVEAMAKESPFAKLCLKVMGVTSKTIEKEVNVVGSGIKKTVDVVVEEVKDVGELATGKGDVKDVLVKPVEGIAEVVGETTYGVINAPIEAVEEVK